MKKSIIICCIAISTIGLGILFFTIFIYTNDIPSPVKVPNCNYGDEKEIFLYGTELKIPADNTGIGSKQHLKIYAIVPVDNLLPPTLRLFMYYSVNIALLASLALFIYFMLWWQFLYRTPREKTKKQTSEIIRHYRK